MQDTASIKFHPLDLSQYGKNPQGLPLYRIVWADSRVEKIEQDGAMHEVPLYAGKADGKWVLEKWLSAQQFHGVDSLQWIAICKERGVEMEYATDGTYEMTSGGGIFPGEVTPALAHLWASQIDFGRENFTDADRARALREAYAQSEKANEEKKDQKIHEILERHA
jgi:hypothetical protein